MRQRNEKRQSCPDCSARRSTAVPFQVDRRDFLRISGGAAMVTLGGGLPAVARAASSTSGASAESAVVDLYKSLNEDQKSKVCFNWNHEDEARGLLRTHVANNWNITDEGINTDFFSDDQRDMIRVIFERIIQPDWHARIDKQLDDDAGGFGEDQSFAIFGEPGDGDGPFEFVMTGRHMTLRCDGNSTDHVAFGGPIFYGHAADGFNEGPDHEGNVFWEQALAANNVYQMLDGKQRKEAEVAQTPREGNAGFRREGREIPGIAVTDLSSDQKAEVQRVLKKLIEPYRQIDQDEAMSCLNAQGGLDACHLAFYTDQDIGEDKVWDNWRLEGPSFVWHFRGSPHVHVWVNVADSRDVMLNAPGAGGPARRRRGRGRPAGDTG